MHSLVSLVEDVSPLEVGHSQVLVTADALGERLQGAGQEEREGNICKENWAVLCPVSPQHWELCLTSSASASCPRTRWVQPMLKQILAGGFWTAVKAFRAACHSLPSAAHTPSCHSRMVSTSDMMDAVRPAFPAVSASLSQPLPAARLPSHSPPGVTNPPGSGPGGVRAAWPRDGEVELPCCYGLPLGAVPALQLLLLGLCFWGLCVGGAGIGGVYWLEVGLAKLFGECCSPS